MPHLYSVISGTALELFDWAVVGALAAGALAAKPFDSHGASPNRRVYADLVRPCNSFESPLPAVE